MNKLANLILGCLFLLIHTACEKIIIPNAKENSPNNNFDSLWRIMDEGYVYFEFKGIDWDSVRTVYEPQVNKNTTDEELFDICDSMLKTLQDGHITLRKSILEIRSYDVMEGFEPNFNKEFIIENYLVPNNMDTTTWIRHCFLNEQVGYLYYSTFTNEVTEEGMNEILSQYENTEGLIIDVRGNLGGDASNVHRLMEHFVSSSTLVGYTQEKNGPGHQELTSPEPIVIEPAGLFYGNPIIVLANRGSYSAANAFIAQMSTLPNVTILGDLSGGGGGLPVTNQLFNGWFFTYTTTIGTLPNGFYTENGVPPDTLVYTDETFEAIGKDNIIEQALMMLQ